MTRSIVFLTGLTFLALWFVEPVLAQHGPGFGAGGFGRGSAGMPSVPSGGFGTHSGGAMTSMPGGADRGHSGSEAGLQTNQHSQGELSKGNSTTTGSKTASELLTQNTKLSSNLQGLLPSGTSVQDASQGFKNLGQFVAAVHVSHNLGIPFDQLKGKMMSGENLGQAIHELKPGVDAHQEAIKGNQQALDDMEKSMAAHR